MMMTINELNEFAKDWVKSQFDLDLDLPIKINGRLRSVLGRCISVNKRVIKIELSKSLIECYSKDEIMDVLKHELVHYSLATLGLPCRDEDQTFIATCKARDVPLTRTIQAKHEIKYAHYECGCDTEHKSRRRLKRAYCCVNCHQPLVYVGRW